MKPPLRRLAAHSHPHVVATETKMGKPKGKRAHRKIDVGEDAYIEKKREDAAAGGAVDELPDDSLFFVDHDGGIASGGGMAFPVGRKAKARAKTLRVDAILSKAKTAKPFAVPVPRGLKGPPTKAFNTKGAETAKTSKTTLLERAAAGKRLPKKKNAKSSAGGKPDRAPSTEKIAGEALFKPSRRFTLDDVLGDDPDAPEKLEAYDLWGGGVDPKRKPVTAKKAVFRKAGALAENAAAYSKHRLGETPKPVAKRLVPYKPSTNARAVQVADVGCSYNPPEDARQDVIAAEVGKITKDALKTQLDPTRAPVSNNEAAMLMSQELFTAQDDMSYGSDDDDAVFGANNPIVTRDGTMTVAQRNRQTRARERRAEEDANRLSKRQRQDLSNLKELKQGLAAVAETQEGKRARLATARAEKKAQTPSRLGKHLYQPEHADVLLTEEVTGSLRTLAGSHTLLRDRLKSLQRRELVEPRKRQQKVKSKNFLKYEPGAKGEKETELHEAALKVTRETSKNKSTPL